VKESSLVREASAVVAETLAEFPAEIREAAKVVPVLFERVPGKDVLDDGFEPDLLGLFTGSPVGTEYSEGNPEAPRIILYTANLWDYAEDDLDAYKVEVRLTFLHELGHYLGWDEGQVAARGLD
jgi:predicted Zn-dependent protease with MMP-like domain